MPVFTTYAPNSFEEDNEAAAKLFSSSLNPMDSKESIAESKVAAINTLLETEIYDEFTKDYPPRTHRYDSPWSFEVTLADVDPVTHYYWKRYSQLNDIRADMAFSLDSQRYLGRGFAVGELLDIHRNGIANKLREGNYQWHRLQKQYAAEKYIAQQERRRELRVRKARHRQIKMWERVTDQKLSIAAEESEWESSDDNENESEKRLERIGLLDAAIQDVMKSVWTRAAASVVANGRQYETIRSIRTCKKDDTGCIPRAFYPPREDFRSVIPRCRRPQELVLPGKISRDRIHVSDRARRGGVMSMFSTKVVGSGRSTSGVGHTRKKSVYW